MQFDILIVKEELQLVFVTVYNVVSHNQINLRKSGITGIVSKKKMSLILNFISNYKLQDWFS